MYKRRSDQETMEERGTWNMIEWPERKVRNETMMIIGIRRRYFVLMRGRAPPIVRG